MASSSHRWESRKRPWEAEEEGVSGHAWEEYSDLPHLSDHEDSLFGDADSGSSVCSDDDENWSPERCGEELLGMLTSTMMEGGMTSLYFCVACYWAVRAGAKGPLTKFARNPGLRSDKYQQHLDRILGHKGLDDKLMDLDVPSCTKKSLGREIRKIAVPPAHELLDEEVLNTSSMTDVIAASVRDNEWSHLYTNHVVVLQARAQ